VVIPLFHIKGHICPDKCTMLLRKIEEDQALYPKVFIKNKGSKVHKSKGTAISNLSKPQQRYSFHHHLY